MSANSKIEWTDHTFNPWIGCTKVSPACDHCYAEVSTPSRTLGVAWGPHAERRRTSPGNWAMPKRWNAQAEAFQAQHGRRQRVFCASLADVFDNAVPQLWRTSLFGLIYDTPHLDWLLLTKRIGNAARMLKEDPPEGIDMAALHNVWLGATIANQEEADRDIPKLLGVPAAKRFLSMEPLLGPVNLWLPTRTWENSAGGLTCNHCCNGDRCDDPNHFRRGRLDWASHCRCPHCRGTGKAKPIDWVIVGGESGQHARPMHPDWARSLRDQCQAAGVPFFFKQWGEHLPGELSPHPCHPGDSGAWRLDQAGGRWHDPNESGTDPSHWKPVTFIKPGKKAAGRLLDGREWNEVPR